MGVRTSTTLTVALCGGYFLVLLDVTVVNVALPSLGSSLAARPAGLAWTVDAYAVPLAALLLAAGAVGDRIGHRRVVLIGYVGFGLASLGCALAPGIAVLVAARAVQGVAAALMLPGTLALLSEGAPDEPSRARIVGVWAAVGGAALPAGPVLGALLVEWVGWRAVFWIGVPVIAAAIVPIVRSAPSRAPSGGRVDRVGALLAVVFLGSAVTAVIEARDAPVLAAGAGVVALISGVALVRAEVHAPDPLLALPVGGRRPLAGACVVAGLMNLCVLGTLFLLTQVLQDTRGLDPLRAGLSLLPAMLPLPLLGGPGGRLTGRWGPWPVSAAGLGIGAVGFAGIAAALVGLPYPALLAALLLWGVGIGLLTPAIVAAAMRAVPAAPGAASGASNTSRQAGGAIGVAIFGAAAGGVATTGFEHRSAAVIGVAAVAFALAAGVTAVTGGRSGPPGQRMRRGCRSRRTRWRG